MPGRWVYACYIVIALLICFNYGLFRLRESFVFPQEGVFVPQLLDKRRNFENLCCNALTCSLDGVWKLRKDVSYGDLYRVKDSNMHLRLRKGWPAQLYHGDMRCGSNYPLQRMIRQKSKSFYIPDVMSQCDGLSNAPCCRNDIGWCGRGDYFCKCESCSNFATMVYTELYEWTHTLNCSKPKLLKQDACDYLGESFTSVTFIGDSLVRHVFSSLLIQLTGDSRAGALKAVLSKTSKDFCTFENQFVDSACHVKLATDWSDVKAHKGFCNTSGTQPKIEFVQAYSSHHNQLALKRVAEALQEQRPLILLGIGIHDSFDDQRIINEYLAPIIELRKQNIGYSNPVFIWLNSHAAGHLKPIGYQHTQGNKNIVHFNSKLREYCQKNSIYIFDTYNITKGVHSFDGTHYGGALNRLKVELLFQSLKTLPFSSKYPWN